MPKVYGDRHLALIVNDETQDSEGQIAEGEEATDGDGRAVITIMRSTLAPTAADVRPPGQLWLRTSDNTMYYSRGAGLWYTINRGTVAAHQATHRAGGSDPLPWTTIIGRGLLSARPAAAAANAGYLYDAYNVGALYRSTGTVWEEVGSSAATKSYTHSQPTPAAAWVVTHNLGRYPAVTVLDTANTEIHISPTHLSINQLTIPFGRPMAGSALCR